MFRKYHYLNHNLNKASRQFVAFYDGVPVAFDSYLHMPHPIAKNIKRQHRLVVKPDYQGIGIGSRLSNFVAERLKSEGLRITSTTSAPSLMFSRKKNPRWKLKSKGRLISGNKKETMSISSKGKSKSSSRITTNWEFI